MTNPHDFEGNHSFTWIPFYMEMAEKLLEYKDNRDELIKIVYGMDRQFINYIKDNGGNDYPDIDPFSVFSIFNRTSTEERRKEICKYFREKLKLTARTPDDFDSIPLMNPKMSVFVWREDIQTGIQPIWNLFSSILSEEQSNDFAHSFDTVIKQRGIKWNLTMALFWIRPHDFIPLDTNSREYLAKIGIEVFDEKNLTAENYLNLIKKIKSKIENNEIKEKSFPEISFNAWKKDAISIGDPTMTQDNTLLDKYTKLLRNTHNLILTGAPGTGKTFMAKKLAEKMGCTPDEIGFVQFHPSYDYTDFVEGLRPVQDESGSGQIGFERK
ncbi:MAG: AAA family ATPase, partial [Treponema sp.]|nr:AAA family ATPase [Treponema sp.]